MIERELWWALCVRACDCVKTRESVNEHACKCELEMDCNETDRVESMPKVWSASKKNRRSYVMTRAPKPAWDNNVLKATVHTHAHTQPHQITVVPPQDTKALLCVLKTHRKQRTNEIKRPQIARYTLSLRFLVVAIASIVRCQRHHQLFLFSFGFFSVCLLVSLFFFAVHQIKCFFFYNRLLIIIIGLPIRMCALFLKRKSVLLLCCSWVFLLSISIYYYL